MPVQKPLIRDEGAREKHRAEGCESDFGNRTSRKVIEPLPVSQLRRTLHLYLDLFAKSTGSLTAPELHAVDTICLMPSNSHTFPASKWQPPELSWRASRLETSLDSLNYGLRMNFTNW